MLLPTLAILLPFFASLPSFVSSVPTNSLVKRQNSDAQKKIDALLSGHIDQSTYTAVYSVLNQINPSATPSSIPQAVSAVANALIPAPSDIYQAAAALIASGITPGNLTQLIKIATSGCNSADNKNPKPSKAVYPQAGMNDAPYSIAESQLRAAIQIPSTFTYGKKPPVILVPGTGSTGCFTFTGNFMKLLSGRSYADPVWLNIPDYQLDDVQDNSEYVAYAINYISAVSSNTNVSIITWSQGSIDSQWAFQYWPSTRAVTSDLISVSPDFHGSVLVSYSCPGVASPYCTPAIIQQGYNSNFITTLRANGGDSAYVPTTTIYSATDEVVQPQSGTSASGYINDARGVGVSNTLTQAACAGYPAGGNYTHAGVLYNPLSYALAVDALTNKGPGSLSRLDLPTVCSQQVAPGLTAQDIVLTEENLIVASVAIALYEPKAITEPPIRTYAVSS